MATVPSPSGLGYVLARLRRSGFEAVEVDLQIDTDDWGSAHWRSRLGICEW